ncbi:tyrosine-type recombinase/integrase [Burkholderia vietnamiensis]|uniref:Tyrosine-type recombinase/integrase n=1 Tax=Burkholderia vietnamiensis TaxID=60552 RepID=A0AAW7SX49_BURVI|nr:tyrosine-type recombinase/integrase [Burkholderia vietnamiensis]MBH9645876.1 tyrosine-type recombinase/integrase [Burkholderia vietnamiensis]MBR8008815.1 tyrosine-type recombinase/integrase [Burkholderia vietnamiensis]MDN7551327.1 tyrosine-type recombinase/integrase [Burkholderia vietnamiensis]MDN7795141.1 tyrosine-type recombinase/integrase [Burkholderia vietnamiensis]MDN8045133.1 tyrosine-type recombinase/integrase [Burkholderia vietnamiensis]
MDKPTLWLSAPTEAYQQWQRTEAAGADRRAFSPRSIVQHEAMFERFMRHLAAAQRSLATFGPDHLESFFADLDRRCKPGTTTRLRYQKLLDRLGRHLVDVGVRKTNPAAAYTLMQTWPEDEPVPVYLLEADDLRLQAKIRAIDGLDDRALRNRAIVGLLLSTGITAQEIRQAAADDLDLSPARPHILIPKRGPREARRINVDEFARPALTRWRNDTATSIGALLFPSPRAGGPMTDEMLGRIVRDELLAVDIRVPDMSPRTLRNTSARRLLLAGRSNDDVMQLLGLTSQRTVFRIRATLPPSPLPNDET